MHASLCRATLALCLTALAAGPALADELELFKDALPLEGQEGGLGFKAQVRFHTDATFTGERLWADGRREAVHGTVAIAGRDFVLTEQAGGVIGVIAGGPAATTTTYTREQGKHYVWRYDDPADSDHAVLTLPCREHLTAVAAKVLGRAGTWNFLFHHNLGKVDDTPGLEILRSRQPQPRHIRRYQQRYGIKTVLSLNGRQDEQVEVEVNGQKTKLTLEAYMQQRGLATPHVGMSAQRAPTDAELVEVFRVLLDDSLKPILLHCHGGADRTGIIAALYEVEFLGHSKDEARRHMRHFMWTAHQGTEIQGAYLDLYQPGHLRQLLQATGVPIPARYAQHP